KKYTMKAPRQGVDAPPLLPYARVQTSRGCPIGCTFCQVESISGKKLRKRSAENIIEELEYLIKEYGIRSVVFEDDNPFADKTITKKLLNLMIQKNIKLKWKATGVYLPAMDEEIFKLMSESGCVMLNIAIESGNERVLKEIIHKEKLSL
ncbi:MAG: radical SAM protein, partial [Candidatus Bathyarchaeia archaeon]